MKKQLNIGIIGLGVVGSSVARILKNNQELIAARAGCNIIIKKGVVRNISKVRDVFDFPITNEVESILEDPEIDIVVELAGGIKEPFEIAKKALYNSKAFITANKAMLAYHRYDLQKIAGDLPIGFEASVAGGIPIIKALRDGLGANHILSICGIINGTCNYILTNMTKNNLDFKDVLKDAQDKGYAEADPTFDIDGIDTAHKLCILSSIAFCNVISFDKIFIRGIRNIILDDIVFASEIGLTIKLIAEAALDENNNAYIYVIPTLLNDDNMLSKVDYAFNAITVVGDRSGDTVFYGSGAGGRPTSSAIVSDAVTLARNTLITDELRIPILGFVEENKDLKVKDFKEKHETFYVRFKSNKNNLLAFNEAFYDISIEKSVERNGNFMFVLKDVNINSIIEAIEKVEKIDDIFIAKIK